MHFDIEICYKNNCIVCYDDIIKVEFRDLYVFFYCGDGFVCKERKEEIKSLIIRQSDEEEI